MLHRPLKNLKTLKVIMSAEKAEPVPTHARITAPKMKATFRPYLHKYLSNIGSNLQRYPNKISRFTCLLWNRIRKVRICCPPCRRCSVWVVSTHRHTSVQTDFFLWRWHREKIITIFILNKWSIERYRNYVSDDGRSEDGSVVDPLIALPHRVDDDVHWRPVQTFVYVSPGAIVDVTLALQSIFGRIAVPLGYGVIQPRFREGRHSVSGDAVITSVDVASGKFNLDKKMRRRIELTSWLLDKDL